MYLRRSVVHKLGKTHIYWRLVESVRNGRHVRQRTVATLGKLDAAGRARASGIARHFLGPKLEQQALFEEAPALPSFARVRTDQVRVEKGRSFGDVWLAWTLWRALGLDDFCREHLSGEHERVDWADVAAILVLARFCEPASELHIAEDWYGRTALDDILGIPWARIHSQRLYRGLDHLLPHKEELEKHLKGRLGSLFDLKYDLMLYDVTSTYFEGEALANPKAQRGHSRDHRRDCKQVCIGLVVTREGYPVGYEVFAGNRTDVTTVQEIVETMERRYGQAERVWVMDRGMISVENLEWLKAAARRFLLGTPKSELRKWERELAEEERWEKIRPGLEVKLCRSPDGDETFILCRSDDREQKEEAIFERFRQRIRVGVASLTRRVERSRQPLETGSIERQIGRLLERNQRAGNAFEITVKRAPDHPSGIRIAMQERESCAEWAKLSHGAYILRTNVTDWSAEELWRTYTQLTDAEAAFRVAKSDLRIRPIWHQREDRVEGHILVCFLAYAMWKTLEGWQSKAGLGSSPRTVIEELKRVQSVDVVLPIDEGPELRLRCVVRPDPEVAMLLDRLGLRLPERLRPAEELAGV